MEVIYKDKYLFFNFEITKKTLFTKNMLVYETKVLLWEYNFHEFL